MKLQRIAERVLLAWSAREFNEYDIMFRLQILEGAAQARDGIWWQRGARGLKGAERAYQEIIETSGQPGKMSPTWLAPQTSPLITILNTYLSRTIQSYQLSIEPADVINGALMGMSLSGNMRGQKKAYQLGASPQMLERILEGSATPETIAKGPLKKFLNQDIQVIGRNKSRSKQVPEEEADKLENPESSYDAGDYLLEIIMYELNDPIGGKIRKLMREVWGNSGPPGKVMLVWLDYVEKGRPAKNPKELAVLAGISDSLLYQKKYWERGWRSFMKALWGDHSLLRDLEFRYQELSIPFFQSPPDMSQVRVATTRSILGHLLQREAQWNCIQNALNRLKDWRW